MTCEMMHEALLQAELSELRREGSGPVATHLRECAACRRDADRILASTAQLGKAVRGRGGWRWGAAIPLTAAAALVLLLLPRGGAPGEPTIVTPLPAEAPAAVATAPPPPGPRPLRRIAAGRRYEAVPRSPLAFEPTPILPAPRTTEARKQPRVLTTSDPMITVLWFD
jgi:hypothetical protein